MTKLRCHEILHDIACMRMIVQLPLAPTCLNQCPIMIRHDMPMFGCFLLGSKPGNQFWQQPAASRATRDVFL